MIYQRSVTFWIVFQVVVAIGVIAAAWYGGDLVLGFACASVLIGSAVWFYVANRRGSSLPGLLTGVGDEREHSIYRQAMFRTAEGLMYVLTLWATAVLASGDENSTLFTILALFGGLWVFNIAWASWSARRPTNGVAN